MARLSRLPLGGPLSLTALGGILVVVSLLADSRAGAQETRLSPSLAWTASSPPKGDGRRGDDDSHSLAAELTAKRARVRARLEEIERQMGQSSPAAASSQQVAHLPVFAEALKYLDIVYAQQQSAVRRRAELNDQRRELRAKRQALLDGGASPFLPHSFLAHDELRDELAAQARRLTGLEAEIQSTRSLLESTHRVYEEVETERRRLQETLEGETDPQRSAGLARQLELIKQKATAVHEAIRQQEMDVDNSKLTLEVARLREDCLREKLGLLSPYVSVSQDDWESVRSRLAASEAETKKKLDAAQARFAEADRACRRPTEAASGPAGRAPVESVDPVETWNAVRDVRQEEVSLLQHRLREIILAKFHWRQRFLIVGGQADREQIRQWRTDIDEALERIERGVDLLLVRTEDRRLQLAAFGGERPSTTDGPRDASDDGTLRVAEIERLLSVAGDQMAFLNSRARFLRRFQEDLSARLGDSPRTRLLATMQDAVVAAWRYEITSIDDRPITVGKIAQGVLLLLAGLFLSRWLSRVLGRRVLRRIGIQESVSVTLQSIAFYVLLTCFGFVSLELINVPLTVFAFMGGAIAIGVGFGSQNILNNFISGLIMLAERPIRVGDLVDVDGLTGTVEYIGARSTRVRTGANLEIIVPNSKFLENNVTNWTLSDTMIRREVRVGVAYGSPTRETERLLRRAVQETPEAMDDPEPIVLFGDFGDSALTFELHFWVRMRTVMQGRRIESELRHTIDRLLREAGITVAFPQRDIHIDTTQPLEIALRDVSSASPAQLNRAA